MDLSYHILCFIHAAFYWYHSPIIATVCSHHFEIVSQLGGIHYIFVINITQRISRVYRFFLSCVVGYGKNIVLKIL